MFYIYLTLQIVTVSIFSKYDINKIDIDFKNRTVKILKQGKVLNCNSCRNKNSRFYRFNLDKAAKITINNKISRYYKGGIDIFLKNGKVIINQKIDIDSYIIRVVAAEMDQILPDEALKAFYLVVKSYTLSHHRKHKEYRSDFCDLAHCQVYFGELDRVKLIKDIVLEVKDKAIYYKNRVIKGYFNSICGPNRASAETIWGKKVGYLLGGKNIFNKRYLAKGERNFQWELKVDKDQLDKYLGGDRLKIVKEVDGYVRYIKNSKKGWSGENFRRVIAKKYGWGALKSNQFKIIESKNSYIFKGYGFGHGVGFCMEESKYLSYEGVNYEDIIHFFFNNVTIK